jgi:hypothetical protein
MPRIKDTTAMPLPKGGAWFADRDEALASIAAGGGLMVDVYLRASKGNVHGVYKTQEGFCKHAKAYLNGLPTANRGPESTPSIMAMLKIHTQVPEKERALYNLPANGKWFESELGALTAYTLLPGSYFVKIYILFSAPTDYDDASLQEAGNLPLYGVFASMRDWDRHRVFKSDTVFEPLYPFEMAPEAQYDRCRCTLMRVDGALYKEPQVELIPEEELEAFARKAQIELPISDFKWTRTKEEAVKLGAHVMRWQVDGAEAFFSVSGDHTGCQWLLTIFVDDIIQKSPQYVFPQMLRRVSWRPVSSCALYGYILEGYNAGPGMQSLSDAIEHQDEAHLFE